MNTPYLRALRAERRDILDFGAALTATEWTAPSDAEGWSVAEVFLHLTIGIRALTTPAGLTLMTSRDLEQLNGQLVAERLPYAPENLVRDFDRWSRRGCAVLAAFDRPVLRSLRLPVAELGWYPMRLAPAMYVFDWHTHLRHDIAPALDRPVPATDPGRTAAVVAWLVTLLEHSHREVLRWLDAPVALTLTGAGGGSWYIDPQGGLLRVRPGTTSGAAARIEARAEEFPVWGTRRMPWRACAVTVTGDRELGTRVLDTIHLV